MQATDMPALFETREAFFAMVNTFRRYFQQRTATTTDFALYALLRGRDWRSGLAPNTNEHLVTNLHHRLTRSDPKYLNLTPFGETVTAEVIERVRALGVPAWGT